MLYKNLLTSLALVSVVSHAQTVDLNQNSDLTENGSVLPSPNEQRYNNQVLLSVPNNTQNQATTTSIQVLPNVSQVCLFKAKTNININYQLAAPIYDYTIRSKNLLKIGQDADVMGLYKGDQDLRIEPIIKILTNNATHQSCNYVSDVTVSVIYNPKIYVAQEASQFQCTFNRVLKHENTHYSIESTAIERLKPQLKQMINQVFDENLITMNEPTLENEVKNRASMVMYNYKKAFSDYTLPYHRQLDNTENYLKEQHECSDEENEQLNHLANE